MWGKSQRCRFVRIGSHQWLVKNATTSTILGMAYREDKQWFAQPLGARQPLPDTFADRTAAGDGLLADQATRIDLRNHAPLHGLAVPAAK